MFEQIIEAYGNELALIVFTALKVVKVLLIWGLLLCTAVILAGGVIYSYSINTPYNIFDKGGGADEQTHNN